VAATKEAAAPTGLRETDLWYAPTFSPLKNKGQGKNQPAIKKGKPKGQEKNYTKQIGEPGACNVTEDCMKNVKMCNFIAVSFLFLVVQCHKAKMLYIFFTFGYIFILGNFVVNRTAHCRELLRNLQTLVEKRGHM
jgi:hypothetical protein